MQSLVNFFRSSAPYTVKDMRVVGEVPSHDLKSLRSLIINIGMFLDLVNAAEKTFEIPLLQKELSISFHFISFVFEVICLFLHVVRRRQSVISQCDSDIFKR
jgi:hypothetical protein